MRYNDHDDPVEYRERDYDDDRGPERDHMGRLRSNPKFGCTGGYCRTGRCESPCDPDPNDLDDGPIMGSDLFDMPPMTDEEIERATRDMHRF